MENKVMLRQKVRKLDFQALEIFHTLYALHNVTATSELLSLSQSTVSYSLNRLRNVFEDELFIPTRSGMMPTQKAKSIADSVKVILEKISDCVDEKVIFSPKDEKVSFTIFAPEYFEILILPMLMKDIIKHELKIHIEMIRPDVKVPFEEILSKRIDLGIMPLNRFENLPSSLEHETILTDKLIAVFEGKPLIDSTLTIDEMLTQKQVFPTPWLSGHCMVESWLKQKGIIRPVAIRANGYYAGLNMLSSPETMMMLPEKIYQKVSKKYPFLYARPAPEDLPGFEVAMVWHTSHTRQPANLWLRKQILKACTTLNSHLQSEAGSPQA